MSTKTRQLQIRVTPRQKASIKRLADRAGVSVSSYVLSCVLPPERARFEGVLRALREEDRHRFALAELNDFLSRLTPMDFHDAVDVVELEGLSPRIGNYVAAMVEHAASRMNVDPPSWTADVAPLEVPWFPVEIPRLRPYLLRVAPVAFKRRNIFVDSTVGDRV